jgi:uncharacterized SAM-binding protein YcdF (DUF218 family)
MKQYLKAITDFVFCENVIQKADIIIIPGATRVSIPERAAELYNKGYASYVAVSGKYSSRRTDFPHERLVGTKYQGANYACEADFLKNVLLQNGVPNERIFQEKKSRNTLENAEYISNTLKQKKFVFKSAIICCQAFHARRIQMTYSFVFPDNQFYICPVATQNIDKYNWYTSKNGIKKVMGEVERCGKYFCDSLLKETLVEGDS